MTLEPSALSRTDRNLWNAIVGEAMAYLKYNAYAHQAQEEGYPEVARIFQEVAEAETIHGLNHLRVAGDVGTTLDNLRTVTVGESREFSAVYPRMIRDAQEEGPRMPPILLPWPWSRNSITWRSFPALWNTWRCAGAGPASVRQQPRPNLPKLYRRPRPVQLPTRSRRPVSPQPRTNPASSLKPEPEPNP